MKISHKNPKPAIAPYINVISENYFARKPYYSYVVDYQQMVSHRMSVAENQSSNILDLVDDRRPKSRNNSASAFHRFKFMTIINVISENALARKHTGFGTSSTTTKNSYVCLIDEFNATTGSN